MWAPVITNYYYPAVSERTVDTLCSLLLHHLKSTATCEDTWLAGSVRLSSPPASVSLSLWIQEVLFIIFKICAGTQPTSWILAVLSVSLQWLAELQCYPAQHFCNSAMKVQGSIMCNEFVIAVFPFGPMLPSHFHLKAVLAYISSFAENFPFLLEIHMNCANQQLSEVLMHSSSAIL